MNSVVKMYFLRIFKITKYLLVFSLIFLPIIINLSVTEPVDI